MATISGSKRRNFKESLWRVANQAWFGQSAAGIDQPPDILNGEYLIGVNAAGTGTVNMIGVNASDQVVTTGGIVLPTTIPLPYVFDAATAVTRSAFIADAAYQVAGVNIVFGVASSSGTFAIEKLTGTTAPGSGTTMLTGTLSTAGTANTVAAGTLTATTATLQLAAGNRVGFVFTGTETSLVGLQVTLSLTRI